MFYLKKSRASLVISVGLYLYYKYCFLKIKHQLKREKYLVFALWDDSNTIFKSIRNKKKIVVVVMLIKVKFEQHILY